MSERNCKRCGFTHGPPTGKRCTRPADMAIKLDSLVDMFDKFAARLDKVEGAHADNVARHARSTSPSADSEHSASRKDSEDSDLADATRKAKSRLADLGLLDDIQSDSESDDDAATTKHKSKGKKSGRLRTADHKTKLEVDWPHYYVYRDGRAAAYNDLTVAEFAFGHASLTDRAPSSQQQWLHAHFKDLMEDASQYRWPVVRNFHGILLNMLETGRISLEFTPADLQKIQDLRRQHVWNCPNALLPRQTGRHSNSTAPATLPPSHPTCPAYQQRSCDHYDSHDGLDHACSYCIRVTGRPLPHPEAVCRRKREHWAKNGRLEA